ncbi:carboxymuconolactone decarboxylase family protein [Xanthomonas campestris]|uniref:carboxymuconolactone decarboxylase family protein n=1 Tax=Xanthomonas campestris TaxID=339 RepID=UPI002B212ED8|nr:carboxymuconolactone decarboxylase family protein [Xanthomonas campestris]
MRNIRPDKWYGAALAALIFYATALSLTAAASPLEHTFPMMTDSRTDAAQQLSEQQRAIVPIAAAAAVGDIAGLEPALEKGLDAGLSINDTREILVQVYAYAGFPRSLNALGQLMKVVDARKQRGIDDAPGREPSKPIPQGDALLKAGTANQTRIVGKPVAGPLFDFAPVANQYLQAHLFGDIFERDNLDWASREIATVSMLAALEGVESQLRSHVASSFNVGLSEAQLQQVVQVLDGANKAYGQRARVALDQVVADQKS